MSDEGPIPTTRKDRFIAKLVAVIAQAIYRDVQVYWPVGAHRGDRRDVA